MELNDKMLEEKNKIVSALHSWIDGRIDQFVLGNPSLVPVRKYLKRGVANLIAKEDERIKKGIDTLMLFIADENGNYDMGTFFDDALAMFKSMPETPFDMGLLQGTIGAGALRIELPDNPIISMMMGNIGAIKLNEEDFKGLKEVLIKE